MNKAQRRLYRGVNKLNNSVKLTLGPNGRNVIIDRDNGSPLITNDGVTIAKQFTLSDRYENLGADVIKQASIKTNEEAGDGTTSAIVLATAIINQARHALNWGHNPIILKDSLIDAARKVLTYLPRYTQRVHKYEDLRRVATNSCANAADGKLVADALTKVGANGLISLEMNKLGRTELQFTNGVKIAASLTSPYFQDQEFVNAKLLVSDTAITSIKELIGILENAVKTQTPLVLLAPEFSPEVINALVLNRAKAGLQVVAYQTAAYEDAAVITNAMLISARNDLTLPQATPAHLGFADKVLLNPEELVILTTSQSPQLAAHIQRLQNQLAPLTDDYQKTRLKERLANLTATAGIISVGCPTDAETMEKRLRIEDAVAATTNAMRDGVVTGGGMTYLKLAHYLDRKNLGERILKKALPAINRQICRNYHYQQIASTVIDPSTVIASVIRNATSAAAILLTTGAIISSAT